MQPFFHPTALHLLSLLHAATVTLGLLTYIALTHSGRQRRPPAAALAWVIALIAFPYLALPVYLLLGTRKLSHRHLARNASNSDGPTLTRGLDLPPPRPCSRFRLNSEGQQALDELLSLLDGAQSSIAVEIFIFREDSTGQAIIDALARAVQRGAQVRLLLDGLGAFIGHRRTARALRAAGVELRWFSPIRLHLHPQFGRGNLRNHRKLVIVDEQRMWSGGRNFASEYFTGDVHNAAWQDLSFILEGDIVQDALAGFARDWAIAGGEPFPAALTTSASHAAGPHAQLLPSGPDRRDDTAHALYINAIHRADVRVWLATPYFVPDDALQQALLSAARRGVHVRLLLPAQSNHRMADIARERSLRELAEAKANIYLLPSMLHAKLVVVDQAFASCGSINLDGRSLFLNYELNTLFFDIVQIGAFTAWFEQQCQHASDYSARPPSWPRDVGEGIVRAVGFQL
ncbi:MAG: PLDc N-terminal domain-containing protein [Thermomonas sp.]|uniref:phospholipase D-like domain-containing protein n=1 Tax=Thermomonas sp. TaxID=1971895 RepID=UPI001EC62702|nr:phospholipase D-like domain-containing protein [Thermomonas sp.]MBV2209048.1 PLDc N-terminal domain-containing protein [Thermomonas sp.]